MFCLEGLAVWVGLVSFGFVGDWDWNFVEFFILGVVFSRKIGSWGRF